MVYETKLYRVQVSLNSKERATIVVNTYFIDKEKQFIGIEFKLGPSTIDNSNISNPGYTPFSFTQELRLIGEASCVFEGNRDKEEKIINEKLTEAYGDKAKVEFKQID